MKPYGFEDIADDLGLMPLAARRAADAAGYKPSLAAWRSLGHADRQLLCALGATPVVAVERARLILARAEPTPPSIEPPAEPSAHALPSELLAALSDPRRLEQAAWSALTPLERYALAKIARKGKGPRLAAALAEIVGISADAPHLDASGAARMVSVSAKLPTLRRAVAKSRVAMNAEAFARLERADAPKGDVLGTARLAGIMGAKRTADLIPLCHPLSLTRVDVKLELDVARHAVEIRVTVEALERTGVEMEALSAASTAALTVYDMLKAFDRAMSIGPTELLEKTGGKSDYLRDELASGSRFQLRSAPLSADEALALVARPDAGASVLFVGVVRDNNQGQRVSELEYEAYAAMAEKELSRLGAEIELEMPGVKLSALHRTGRLRVGETAVLCAASAPHRDEAFRAARLLIDRVKARVPIWKRESGADGVYWVGWEDARTAASDASHADAAR